MLKGFPLTERSVRIAPFHGLPHFKIAPRSAAQSSRGLRDAINSARRTTFLSWFKKKKKKKKHALGFIHNTDPPLFCPACQSPAALLQPKPETLPVAFSCGGRIPTGIRRWEGDRALSAGWKGKCWLASLPPQGFWVAELWQSWLEEGAASRHAGGSGEGHRHAVCAELYCLQALSHDRVGVGQRLQSYFMVIKVRFQSG